MSDAKKTTEKAGDVPKVYVTKYALTDGIRLVKCSELDEKWGWVTFPGIFGHVMVRRGDIHHTLEAAQERAKFMAEKKIGSLEKQIAKMKKIASDGAKVVES